MEWSLKKLYITGYFSSAITYKALQEIKRHFELYDSLKAYMFSVEDRVSGVKVVIFSNGHFKGWVETDKLQSFLALVENIDEIVLQHAVSEEPAEHKKIKYILH